MRVKYHPTPTGNKLPDEYILFQSSKFLMDHINHCLYQVGSAILYCVTESSPL